MRTRIKKLETALGVDRPAAPFDLDAPKPREFCENLHKIYGDPGTPVDYSLTDRDFLISLVLVYGALDGGPEETLRFIEDRYGREVRAQIEASVADEEKTAQVLKKIEIRYVAAAATGGRSEELGADGMAAVFGKGADGTPDGSGDGTLDG